jgi:hypothetical protein
VGITALAWRLGPRWASLSLAADGSSLTLHSTRRHEVVDIERPVELRLYDTTTHGHDEAGNPVLGRRADLFITSGGRSIVVSAMRRMSELRSFANEAAAILGAGPPVIEEVDATGDGHRRDDPATRWVNGGLYVGRGWRAIFAVVGLVLGFLVVWPLTVGAIATVATEPEAPSVVSAEAVERQLVVTTDDLATDLRLDEASAVEGPATQVVAAPCKRDQHEWFWGPVGASRLDVMASTDLHGVGIDGLTQQLEEVAVPSGDGRFHYREAPSLQDKLEGSSPEDFDLYIGAAWLDIEVHATSISVTVETACVRDGNASALIPELRRHARNTLALLVAGASHLDG